MDSRPELQRFIDAQDRAGTYARALEELRAGHKTSHWMWFVFPQLTGLGRSEMSRAYAIESPEEAAAYLSHPILGARLRECCRVLLAVEGRGAVEVMGEIDAVKLRSSMTLFARADPDEPIFARVLDRYFAGKPDPETERRMGDRPKPRD